MNTETACEVQENKVLFSKSVHTVFITNCSVVTVFTFSFLFVIKLLTVQRSLL